MNRYVRDYRLPVKASELKGQFQPPKSREELERLFYNAVNDVIYVPSSRNKLKYSFQGVRTMKEFTDALLFAVQDDFKSGTATYNAKCGYPVYSHGMYERVKRKLYGV